MGKKWATVAVTGYKGAATPSDDGAATEANRVKYSTIYTDLTDPIKTGFDSAIANLDALFTEATTAISSSHTTVASDHATWIEVTGTSTISLLAAATATAGYRVGIKNVGTDLVTVARTSTDTIDGATSVTLSPSTGGLFLVNAAVDGYIQDVAGGSLASTASFAARDDTAHAPGAPNDYNPVDIAYDTEQFDNGTLFNAANGRFTPGAAHVNGVFQFFADIRFTGAAAANLGAGETVTASIAMFNVSDQVVERRQIKVPLHSTGVGLASISGMFLYPVATHYFMAESRCSETSYELSSVIFTGTRVA